MKWFGKSWGAPCCDPEDHVPTPVRETCLHCLELILVGDQGITAPLVLGPDRVVMSAAHLDCFLKRVLPHGPECPHCRGRARKDHALRCNQRQTGGDCNCIALEDL